MQLAGGWGRSAHALREIPVPIAESTLHESKLKSCSVDQLVTKVATTLLETRFLDLTPLYCHCTYLTASI